MAPRTLNVTFAADSSQVGKAFDSIEAKAGGMGDKLSSVGTKLTAAVTLPLIAVGAKAFTMAADAEDATSAMNVVFGKSADVIEKWSKDAATSMGLTSTEAKKAATDLAIFGKAGGLAGKDLTDFATQQSQLSADLASFKGTSVEEAMTAIGAAYRGETEPIRAYGVLLDAQKIKDEAVALGLAKQGEELDNNAKLMATRSLIMKATSDQQGDFARTSEGAANKMKILSAQIKEQVTGIGTQLLPLGQKLLGMVSGWLSAFTAMGPAGQRMVLMFGGLAAAIGPVLLIIAKLVQSFDVIKLALQGFKFNPVVLGITLLIGALVLLWKHSETFRNIVTEAFEAVSNFIGGAIEKIRLVFSQLSAMWNDPDITSDGWFGKIEQFVGWLRTTFDSLKAWWNGIWPQFSEAVGHVWTVIQGVISAGIAVVSAIWKVWGDDLLAVLKGAWNAIYAVVSGALQVIGGIIKTVLAIINGDWGAAWEGIKQIFSGVWTAIKGIVQGALGVIRGIIGAAWDAVRNLTSAAWDSIRGTVSSKVEQIIGFVRGIPGRILGALGGLGGLLVGAGRAIMDGLLNGIISAWNRVASYLSGLASKIKSLKGPIEKDRKMLQPEGAAIMDGLLKGIAGKQGALSSLMGGITDQLTVGGGGQAAFGATGVGAGGGPVTIQLMVEKQVLGQIVAGSFQELLRGNPKLVFQP